jgi:uncharacterized protein (DUF924 family)
VERWRAIGDFWFGDPDGADFGEDRDFWFGGGPEVDAEIRRNFHDDYRRAAVGEYDVWRDGRHSCLALIVLLDQFPRNIYRGHARSFAADSLALATAKHAVEQPWHAGLTAVEKLFVSLPFEHSENLVDQDRCVALVEAIDDHPKKQEWLDYAVRHRVIIERFGRFPHRNEILGRPSTPEELAWLGDGGHRFGTDGKPPGQA